MAGKSEMVLNPADLKVDDSLPAYPVLQLPKAKPTDKEVAEGKPLRIAARKKVLDMYNREITNQRDFKREAEREWNRSNNETRRKVQARLDFYNKNPQYLDLFNYLKQELVWWDNNVELSPREVAKRDLQFDETIKKKTEVSEKAYKDMLDGKTQKAKEEEEKEKKRLEAIRNRSLYDDITDSLIILAKSIVIIFYIVIGLRCASFAANELLYKPVPYRLLAFVYTFIFCPIFAPYYLWKVLKNYIWGTPLPLFEGLLPINSYDPSDPLTLSRRLFGYADTPALQEWIRGKQDEESKARDQAVVSKGIKQKIIDEHNA